LDLASASGRADADLDEHALVAIPHHFPGKALTALNDKDILASSRF